MLVMAPAEAALGAPGMGVDTHFQKQNCNVCFLSTSQFTSCRDLALDGGETHTPSPEKRDRKSELSLEQSPFWASWGIFPQ
jgi:hypothetical protein